MPGLWVAQYNSIGKSVRWSRYLPVVPIQMGIYLIANVFCGVNTLVKVFEYEDE